MKNENLLMTAIAILGLATITMAQVPSYVPTNGLVGWWPFNGNANDESGNGNDGTVNGPILSNDRFGDANKSFDFSNSLNQYIDFGNISTLNSSTSFSISAWFNYSQTPTSPNDWFTIVADGSYSDPNGFGVIINPNQILFRNNSSFGVLVSNTLNLNTWYNIAAVYSSDSVKVYLNSILIGQNSHQNTNLFNTSYSFKAGKCDDLPIDPNDHEYFFNGKIDDIGMWDRVLTQQEITDLYNGCSVTVTTQPINQSVTISNNAQFVVNSSDPSATYQWQTDLGVGYQNLNSVGQYSGTTNDTLTIANTTLSNNNQPFRCIISSGSCTDTSNVAVLTVNNNVGINEFKQDNLFSVFPNPAQSVINVKADGKLIGSVYSIYDNTGRVVLSGKLNAESTTIELGNLSGGIYMFSVGENLKQTFKVKKE